MSDLISRQTAIDDIETVNPSMPLNINWVKNWVKTLPSAQPEGIYYVKFSDEDYEKIAEQLRKIPIVLTLSEPEIVRCAECKWFQYNMRFDGHLPKGVDEFECRHWCGSCDPTDFCSYAERKWEEDEDE